VIYVATSGYSYPDWIGPVYPQKTARNRMLEYYSSMFPFTEINSTYYHLPSVKMFTRLPERTPDTFRFSVKAHQSMTHERGATQETCQWFLAALEPLIEAGRLICVLLQFPYSFHHTPQNRDYLLQLAQWLPGVQLAVEFRQARWISQDTFSWLRQNNLCYVSVDGPILKGLVGPHAVTTGSFAYVRFHGRNAEKWWRHEQAHERYNYLYNEQELSEWVKPLHKLEEAAAEVFVCFNNHFIGQAVVNARMMVKLL
jgi:uncharacterized protein YecE (DUF72 family)